ncbi:MAG: hypothetical protein AB1758_19385 [Candidatus Eremiobacterota bacterium]
MLNRRKMMGDVDRDLVEKLRQADVHGFLTTVRSVRLRKYADSPIMLMRDGWRLDAGEKEEDGTGHPRHYRVGDSRTGQLLVLDRHARVASLHTYFRTRHQVIEYDLSGDQVLSNRLA